MEPPSGTAREPAGEPRTLSRQRWRLVLARAPEAPELAGRELTEAWELAISNSGLPLHRPPGQTRARIAWGSPLPSRMASEHELADIVLFETLPVWRVREALRASLPDGWSLVDLHDVWVGAPALAGQVTGAVYRVTLDGAASPAEIEAAATGLLGARDLVRTRQKGGSTVTYDLRALLADVRLVEPGPPVGLRIATRIHPERGSGRPEEVVAALGELAGRSLSVRSIVRERLILADEGD